jgi:site-specific recombinase XerD
MSTAVPKGSVEAFLRYITATRSGATARRYRIALDKFLVWWDRVGLPQVTEAPTDVLSMYGLAMLRSGYMLTTVSSQLAGISRFLRWLSTKGYALPVFDAPELPRAKRKVVKDVLNQDVMRKYMQDVSALLEEPARTAALLLPCSGLRCAEMVSLRLACVERRDVELPDGRVKKTLLLRVVGKGGHERVVPLLDEGAQALIAYLKGWRRLHPNTKWLFPGRSGQGHASTRHLRRVVQQIRTPSGLEYTPHSMRRTYLTSLHRSGVDIVTLSKIAGHSSVKVLTDHYLNLDASDLSGAVHSTAGGRLIKNKKGTADL